MSVSTSGMVGTPRLQAKRRLAKARIGEVIASDHKPAVAVGQREIHCWPHRRLPVGFHFHYLRQPLGLLPRVRLVSSKFSLRCKRITRSF